MYYELFMRNVNIGGEWSPLILPSEQWKDGFVPEPSLLSPSCLPKYKVESCRNSVSDFSHAKIVPLGDRDSEFNGIDLQVRDFDKSASSMHYAFNLQGTEHLTYFGEVPGTGPVMVIISPPVHRCIKVLVCTKKEDRRLLLPQTNMFIRSLKGACPMLVGVKLSLAKPEPFVQEEISNYERLLIVRRHKFGVLYASPGQTKELEFFQNQTSSPAFEEFLRIIGDVTPLKGFTGYRGGLDVKSISFIFCYSQC